MLIYFQLQCQQSSCKGKKKSFSSLSFVRWKTATTQILCLPTATIKFRKLLWRELPCASARLSAYLKESVSGFSIPLCHDGTIYFEKKKGISRNFWYLYKILISTAFISYEIAELGSCPCIMSPAFQVSQGEECPESSLQEYLKLSGWPDLTLALEMKALFKDEGIFYL